MRVEGRGLRFWGLGFRGCGVYCGTQSTLTHCCRSLYCCTWCRDVNFQRQLILLGEGCKLAMMVAIQVFFLSRNHTMNQSRNSLVPEFPTSLCGVSRSNDSGPVNHFPGVPFVHLQRAWFRVSGSGLWFVRLWFRIQGKGSGRMV